MTDYSAAQEILNKSKENITTQEAPAHVDKRDVVFITTDCPIDTAEIVSMLCDTLSLEFNVVVENHLYTINVDSSNNEEIENKCNELLSIYSKMRQAKSSYSERLKTQYSIHAILGHSSGTNQRIDSINVSIADSKNISDGLEHLQSITKEDWINEITNYLFTTVINVSKESLKKYIEIIFEEHGKLIDGKVYNGIENNSIYALINDPSVKKTSLFKEQKLALDELDRLLKKEIDIYNLKNSSDFEMSLNNLAKSKTAICNLSLIGFDEYQKADYDDMPTLELSKAFPKFQGIKTTGVMREDIFEFYTLRHICNWGYKGSRMITRSVVNAAIAWYSTNNYYQMLEHIENCLENNLGEKEILSILN